MGCLPCAWPSMSALVRSCVERYPVRHTRHQRLQNDKGHTLKHANLRTWITARKVLTTALAFQATLVLAQTQAYPNRLIQLIAQQPPGSQSEAISRVWADCASRELGQPIVTLNKPGANGVLATN